MAESGVRRLLPLLALLSLAWIPGACGPAEESGPPPAVPAVATSDLPPPLDPAPPREIVIGKLFSPDGSILAPDRTASFPRGARILLSVESGDLPKGAEVSATWTAPDGTATEQMRSTLGGEAYLTYTAPSAGWTPGVARVTVRIERSLREEPARELAFEVSP